MRVEIQNLQNKHRGYTIDFRRLGLLLNEPRCPIQSTTRKNITTTNTNTGMWHCQKRWQSSCQVLICSLSKNGEPLVFNKVKDGCII
ncbi:cyclin-dependent kinase subunit 30A isoform X1 [Ptiloglossa arizonensis]|uniref:cyclin-dependent kinase subunit 30A isoform X1 n=1 Tax=Ptiloglossa arizonensis TaxID=3350558 RepID=UPI003FA09876